MRWLIDMDDTLAMGYLTWAVEHVIPSFIREHGLPYEATAFAQGSHLLAEYLNNR